MKLFYGILVLKIYVIPRRGKVAFTLRPICLVGKQSLELLKVIEFCVFFKE